MSLTLTALRPNRATYAVAAIGFLTAAILEAIAHGGGWQIAAFALAPDLALVLGAGKGLEKGQLHPRAVPVYNAVHRFWGPLALGLLAVLGVIPIVWLVGALTWCLHISLDRVLGYGLRTPAGFQR
jgi:Domain of unknown function (DUF4260)